MNGTPIVLSERLEESDVELLKARPNVGVKRIDLTGKLDFKVNDAIDFTLGGSYYDDQNHFAPNRAWNLLNWQNNPYENKMDISLMVGSDTALVVHHLQMIQMLLPH